MEESEISPFSQAWLVAADMGYGHQRAAYPLKDLALNGKIINANNYEGMPDKDRNIWKKGQQGYEFISRFRQFPLLGKIVFGLFDRIQRISSFYPKRDLSKPNLQLKQIFSLIKKGWGKHLIDQLKLQNADLPFITTFFTIAFMAEFFKYPRAIYCLATDTDISRTWASLNPKTSKIKYFAPTNRVAERLKLYGIKPKNIFLTGFPLPQELINQEDVKNRIVNLDPQKQYLAKYKTLVEKNLGRLPLKADHPLTLMFAVGGAGAQKEIGVQTAGSLAKKHIKVILVAGVREEVKEYFEKKAKYPNVEILFAKDKENYFKQFNQALKKTDILWTKPSELSFYSALGLPIIIAPPLGSQEEFNKRWLLKSGFGLEQGNPEYTNQWLFDWLEHGHLAESAMQGFIEGEKSGTINIEKIIFNKNSVSPVLEKQRSVRNRRFLKEGGSGETR